MSAVRAPPAGGNSAPSAAFPLLFPADAHWELTPSAKTCWAPEEGGRAPGGAGRGAEPAAISEPPWARGALAEPAGAVGGRSRGAGRALEEICPPAGVSPAPWGVTSLLTAAGVGVQLQNPRILPKTERRSWFLQLSAPQDPCTPRIRRGQGRAGPGGPQHTKDTEKRARG